MDIRNKILNLEWLRNELVGRNLMLPTPYGDKPLVYLDYTASGRSVTFIEKHLNHIRQYYANSHTEDDFTGKTMTMLLHEAEKRIKKAVNAGDTGRIIFTESGTTGGITRLQQILGVYISPATKERYEYFLDSCLKRGGVEKSPCHDALLHYIDHHKPIVFVSPYEHHSNEIMWRQTLCDVVEIPLNTEGQIDLTELEKIVSDEQYSQRPKIGSFSAGSNVTGILSQTYKIARILHRHDCIACFDFAACAPYVEINMNYDKDSFFDAVFFSPHKFLGGPGASGVLIINERIYRSDLPPSISAGGTVDYVSCNQELYVKDIETREKPGTPGIMQALRTALVFELKNKVGINNIEDIEQYYMESFYNELKNEEKLSFLGETNPDKKVGIIPFNIKFADTQLMLHPKFVTKLLNDLFGIQTRAGCSCAGPYGHLIMNIKNDVSMKYMKVIAEKRLSGLKPGWVRLNLHYVLDEDEYNYTVEAIRFICRYGERFLSQYNFNLLTGEWTHINEDEFIKPVDLDIDKAMAATGCTDGQRDNIADLYRANITEAIEIASKLPDYKLHEFSSDIRELVYFPVVNLKKS